MTHSRHRCRTRADGRWLVASAGRGAPRAGRTNRPREVATHVPDAVNDSFAASDEVNDSFTASPPNAGQWPMASARRQALRARETGPDEPAERTGRANRPSEVANPTPDAVNDSFMSWNAVNDSFTASPPDVT